MAATTTLIIRDLEVQYSLDSLTYVVIEVGTTLSGTDIGADAQINKKFILSAPDSSSFIAFADLTESDVANFVKATDKYSTAVQQLTNIIYEQQQTPTTGLEPLPWA